MHRTTILLDVTSKQAARQVGKRLGITSSEVIRRAIINLRDQLIGPSPARRRQRVATLKRLSKTFRGHDAAAEIRALKLERAGR